MQASSALSQKLSIQQKTDAQILLDAGRRANSEGRYAEAHSLLMNTYEHTKAFQGNMQSLITEEKDEQR